MNFQDAEKAYRDLKQQYDAGKLTEEQLEEQVGNLLLQDEHGHWWQIGVESGDWYMHDGQNWHKAKPPAPPVPEAPPHVQVVPPVPVAPVVPIPPAQVTPPAPVVPAPPVSVTLPPVRAVPPAPVAPAAPVTPVVTPPSPVAPSAQATVPVTSPVPPPAPVVTAATRPAPTVRATPPSDLAAHVHKSESKGLPTPTKIGIIAFAVVVLLFVVGGCLAINAMLGRGLIARATTTPTRSLTVIPKATLTPFDTPLPPTVEATATETPTLAKPTATRRPVTATPAGPTATATVNVPPGVYVTNIETIPSKVNVGDTIGFKVSFLNTTGSVQTFNWLVKVYRCPEQCEDFKHSHGDTLTMNSNLPPGTSAFSTSQNVDVKAGISCDLVAVANYIDPVNQSPTPFQSTKNDGHIPFTPCH